jgi:asparagine synthase (glutamine-hydrolysing)
LLSGEGADESLAGYSWFLQMMQHPYLKKYFLSKLKQNKNSLLPFLRYYTNKDQRMVMGSAFGTISTAAAVMKNFDLKAALKERTAALQGLNGDKLLKYRKYEMLTYLPDLLMRQDKMSMAHSIENRVPFLDNQMIETSLNLSQKDLIGLKNGKTEGKVALKEICAGKLGDSFAYRRKMGFGIPLKEFMSSPAFQHKWKEEILPGIIKRQIFSATALQTWMKNLPALNSARLDMLWLMTGFELWAKQYLN